MALLLLAAAISVVTVSCESKASKEAREVAIRIEAEQKVRAEMEAEKAAEQERIAAEERARKEEQEESERFFNRFVGTYTFYESKYEQRYGVLSDGRIVVGHVGIVDGKIRKEYCGEIDIISDDAFVIRPAKRVTYYVGPVDYHVQRDRKEVWVGRSTPYIENLVFEISTNRAYMGYSSYQNRDVAEAEYLKFRHSSSLF